MSQAPLDSASEESPSQAEMVEDCSTPSSLFPPGVILDENPEQLPGPSKVYTSPYTAYAVAQVPNADMAPHASPTCCTGNGSPNDSQRRLCPSSLNGSEIEPSQARQSCTSEARSSESGSSMTVDSSPETGAVTEIDADAGACFQQYTSITDAANQSVYFDWTTGRGGSGHQPFQPSIVRFFVRVFASNSSVWLLFPPGKLDDLCDSYRSKLYRNEASNAAAGDDGGLLQLPFVVALGIMAAFEVPLGQLGCRNEYRYAIDGLFSWIADSLSEILACSYITPLRIRALLLAALYFECQIASGEASEYLNVATCMFQEYLR
ncbi:hypothetical protein FALBO_11636 [Fusarium albosuccineum]|uniref:Transcription factor domain-containing protein n=1 Tax=Fusarium albosuccineum TaxID=1237068 RepID=A0A8H4P9W9_9HYPO|nr:hypothetical protein FALBO_11636 [Fusarium albosuccineum]